MRVSGKISMFANPSPLSYTPNSSSNFIVSSSPQFKLCPRVLGSHHAREPKVCPHWNHNMQVLPNPHTNMTHHHVEHAGRLPEQYHAQSVREVSCLSMWAVVQQSHCELCLKGLALGSFVVSDCGAMSMHFEAFSTSYGAARFNKKHRVHSIVSRLFVKHFTIEMY